MDPIASRFFIDDQLGQRYRAYLPDALTVAYKAVESLRDDSPLFRIPSAELGHLRGWGADLAVKQLIDRGKWPFSYEFVPFRGNTGHWLRVRLPHSVMSVHQVSSMHSAPRDANYRVNAFANNQGVLDLDGLREERRVNDIPHLILTHGYQSLKFIQVGLPSEDGSFFACTNNIMNELRVSESTVAPPEAVGLEPEVRLKKLEEVEEFKEEILRFIKKSQ